MRQVYFQSKCQEIIELSIGVILCRMAKAAEQGYPFIDTKFDILTGRNFGCEDAPFKQRGCVYSWIQGRGLESLAKHYGYFVAAKNAERCSEIKIALERLAKAMEKLRRKNHGRLPFAMTPDGTSFFPAIDCAANFSDLFYGKGLYTAGCCLDNRDLADKGRELFNQVLEAIENGTFVTDQQSFDPKNKVAFVKDKFPQGPRMIALGGLAELMLTDENPERYCRIAREFIEFILEYHVQKPDNSNGLCEFDFVEALHGDGSVWKDGEVIFCDPGHALEFTGLAAKCLLGIQKANLMDDAFFGRCEKILPRLFCHVFDLGFNKTAGGICKGFDLASRKPVNSDMPWWSLPEAVRAATLLNKLFPRTLPWALKSRKEKAFTAFINGFLQKNGFGCQTRDSEGNPVPVIPAVPDADPGYHTNLSLLECL